jgi:hypothetical protein
MTAGRLTAAIKRRSPTVAQNKTATKTVGKRQSSSRSTKKATVRTTAKAGDKAVTIDRRRVSGRRDEEEGSDEPVVTPALERRQKVNRRRQIDPTTCERDYTDQEVEFMNALDDYKRKSGRMFPTCSEVLEVFRSLGYVKLTPGTCGNDLAQAPSAKPMPGDMQGWVGSEQISLSNLGATSTL